MSYFSFLIIWLPINRLLAPGGEVGIGLRKVARAEESVVGREWRWVCALEDQVPRSIHHCSFPLSVGPPQQVDNTLLTLRYAPHHSIRKSFPTVARVRGSLVGPDGERGIQQQHALFGPAVEVARGGNGLAQVALNLLENIAQRGGKWHSVVDREAESIGHNHLFGFFPEHSP